MQNSKIEEQRKKPDSLIWGSETIIHEPFFDFNGSNITVSLIKIESLTECSSLNYAECTSKMLYPTLATQEFLHPALWTWCLVSRQR